MRRDRTRSILIMIAVAAVLTVLISTVYYLQVQYGSKRTTGIQNTTTTVEQNSTRTINSNTSTTTTPSNTITTTLTTPPPIRDRYTATIQTETQTVTTTSHRNTFLTSCSITGTGDLYLRVVSDSTGTPVKGANISTTLSVTCNFGQVSESQLIYSSDFTEGRGGWLHPVLPPRSSSAGVFNFTVQYGDKTYIFPASISPMAVSCVTLQVPSGIVTSATYTYFSGDCASP